jgi:hypothetical protein
MLLHFRIGASICLLLATAVPAFAQSDVRYDVPGPWRISSIPDRADRDVGHDDARHRDVPAARPSITHEDSRSVCGLLLPGSDAATSRECLECHARLAHGGHPYDLNYARWGSATAGGRLRPINEVLRRGLFLPDQEIRCVTCHDRRSPWRFYIRLPAGSPLAHAVDPKRPETYENRRPLPPPRPGDDIARKPLCLGCHALD